MSMPEIYRYATVDLPLVLSDPSVLNDYSRVVVSFKQGNNLLFHMEDGLGIDTETGTIDVRLEQSDTAKFSVGEVTIQVNVYLLDTDRIVSSTAKMFVHDNLYRGIIG